jgi:hypothetical protein
MLRGLFLLIISVAAISAYAQLDPSSAVLLRPSSVKDTSESLDTSRYKVRAPESRKSSEEDLDEKPGTFIPSPVQPHSGKSKKKKDEAAQAENTANAQATPVAPAATPPAQSPAAPLITGPGNSSAHAVSEQVRELILGGTAEDIDEYRRQIHPQDPRANVLSISIAPAYFYESSQSEYSFRRYTSNGPAISGTMNLWLTPFFGLQSKYFASVTGAVRAGPVDVVPMDVLVFDAGLRFRKHFGYSRKAAHLSWGLDWHDSSDKIARDSTVNVSRRSSGMNFALEAAVPASNTYAHTFDLGIQPRLHHSEPATGASARSGEKNETNAISLAIGGEWILDRRNQVFWKSQYNIERSLFQGPASATDPHTGGTPTGVSVTNSQLIFYFGFKWGS